jgi:hypothetical protein
MVCLFCFRKDFVTFVTSSLFYGRGGAVRRSRMGRNCMGTVGEVSGPMLDEEAQGLSLAVSAARAQRCLRWGFPPGGVRWRAA